MTHDKTELALLALPSDMNCLVAEPLSPDIAANAAVIAAQHRIIRFNDCLMIEVLEPYPHFIPVTREHFVDVAYPLLGRVKRSHLNNVFDHLSYSALDLRNNDHLVLFGNLADPNARLSVWDMDRLVIRADIAPEDCIRRSPYSMQYSPTTYSDSPIPLILSLAGDDMGLYSDIMQSLAPLIMLKKPVGVIWLVGGDANSKSILLEALNKIFPDQLSSLTFKQMIGGRSNTLQLNDMLGNVAEDSDSRVTDTVIYKSIGTHQDFQIHKYHSQHGAEVQGNVHHIFSASNYPTFSTRGQSVDWRTHVIPINQQFDSSRTHTLTDSLLSQLIVEMCHYAKQLEMQGYCYDWSATTRAARAKYYPETSELGAVRSHPVPTHVPFRW